MPVTRAEIDAICAALPVRPRRPRRADQLEGGRQDVRLHRRAGRAGRRLREVSGCGNRGDADRDRRGGEGEVLPCVLGAPPMPMRPPWRTSATASPFPTTSSGRPEEIGPRRAAPAGGELMFPRPIETQSRAAQITYQSLLPLALILWLLPLNRRGAVLHQARRRFHHRQLLGLAQFLRGIHQLREGVLRKRHAALPAPTRC